MMGTTHALMGLLFGATAYFIDPSLLVLGGIAGFIGGLLPDLDMIFKHRKTLHFPDYYTALTLIALPAAVFFTSNLTVFAFYLLAAAAIHSYVDVLGGGLEDRPWEGNSDEAVYNHRKGEWHEPRRWIRYDGAPKDFLLGLLVGSACIVIYSGPIQSIVIGSIGISLVYSIIRKKMVEVAPQWLKDIF